MEAAEQNTLPVWSNFRFTGTGPEYFRIWIVNVLLTIVTLGIYSPWAKVRRMSYFYGNTWLNDSSFAYLANPVKILKGRIIAVGVLAVYWLSINLYPTTSLWALAVLCLLFPFVLVTAMAFRTRNSAYRNIQFYFHPDFLGAYRIFILPIGIILVVTGFLYWAYLGSGIGDALEKARGSEFHKEDMLFSIFILVVMPVAPYIDFIRRRYIVNHVQYGSATGSFKATAWAFYKIYLLAFLFVIGLFFIVGVVAGVAIPAMKYFSPGEQSPQDMARASMSFLIIIMVIFYGLGFFVAGYVMARLANLTYNNAELGPLRLHSHLQGRKIGWLLLSNTVAIIVSLGLLIPWSKIRMARYIARNTEFLDNKMDSINAVTQPDRSAIGEEISNIFDFDIGL